MKVGEQVQRALKIGYTSVCADMAAVSWSSFDMGSKGVYREIRLLAGEREIEVTISPKGHSVRVFVDGNEV